MEYQAIITKEDLLAQDWIEIEPKAYIYSAGIYRLINRDTDEIIYVGRSTQIGARLLYKHHPVYMPSEHKVSVLFMEPELLKDYEALVISLLNPPANRRNGNWTQEGISRYADEWWKQYNKNL